MKTAKRRNPLLRQEPALDLDGLDCLEMSPEQKADRFWVLFVQDVDPLRTYSGYFRSSAKSEGHIIRDIKRLHMSLVGSGRWSERKLAVTLDSLMAQGKVISVGTLDFEGRRYDRELAASSRRR